MANLFTFCLENLARAIAGRASLDDTRQLFSAWRQLFPQPAPQEQQLDGNEFAVYLTAVARESRALHGPNWNRPNALAAVRASFLGATTSISPAAAARRALGPASAPPARRAAARKPSRKRSASRAVAAKRQRRRASR